LSRHIDAGKTNPHAYHCGSLYLDTHKTKNLPARTGLCSCALNGVVRKACNCVHRDNSNGAKQASAKAAFVACAPGHFGTAAAKRTCGRATHLTQQAHYFAVGAKQNAGKAAAGYAARGCEDSNSSADVVAKALKKMISPKVHKSFLLTKFF